MARLKNIVLNSHFGQTSVCDVFLLEASWRAPFFSLLSAILIFVSGFLRLEANPPMSLPSPGEISNPSNAPHAFPLSESELRDLAQALAPKVDLFQAVWKNDPEAEFFAGTTRDYLYWILGHFKGLENLDSTKTGLNISDRRRGEIEAIKSKLLAIPFIKFNEIVGPESDADIMTKNRAALEELRAADFAIRKLDFISFDRALSGQPMYQDEIDQGYIPSEKIRLSKKGITMDPNFGNGVSDLISGKLAIHFPDIQKFWKTYYAKQSANHPLLLALRYVRILSQDYLQRHGSEIPDTRKLEAPMTREIKLHIQTLIQKALHDSDGSFKNFLKNEQGKKWLNASLQKSFRSFTNANAAFELLKELGILGLIEVYSNEIESVHQYLLKTKRDETKIAENFKKFEIKPEELYEKLKDYLPDLELFHGTASELAFRNIIYQGVIPSTDGSAGRGLYGVSKKDLEFAKEWSRTRSQQDDLVIALKLKPNTKIVDITKGKGKELFERWRQGRAPKQSDNSSPHRGTSAPSPSAGQNSDLSLCDSFSQVFGIDILKYPYTDENGHPIEAFVLKNADMIDTRRGVFKNPRPLSELLSEAETAREKLDFSFLKDFLETPLTKNEKNKVIEFLGDNYFKNALEAPHFESLRKLLHDKIAFLCEWLLDSSLTDVHSLVWNQVPSLFKDPDEDVRWNMTRFLEELRNWPSSFWNEIPALMKNISDDIRRNTANALKAQKVWPPEVWDLVPALLKCPTGDVRFAMTLALYKQSDWPNSVWNQIIALLQHPDADARWNALGPLKSQKSWPTQIWNLVPTLLKDTKQSVRSNMIHALHDQTAWPPEVWIEVPTLLKDPIERVRLYTTVALQGQSDWPQNIWDLVPDLMNDKRNDIRSNMTVAVANQKSWPESFWNQVPELFRNSVHDARTNICNALEHQTSWPDSFWNQVPALLRNSFRNIRWHMTVAMINKRNDRTWPVLFWNQVPELLKDPIDDVRSLVAQALRTQSAWSQEVIDLVSESTSKEHAFIVLKTLRPSVLDFSSCERNLSEISDQPSQASSQEKSLP